MAENIPTNVFWDGITNYSGNAMTNTQANFEMSCVHECVPDHPNPSGQIKDLFCMGAADGKREPISILDHIQKKGGESPSRLIINDISTNLLNEAKDNLVNGHYVTAEDDRITYYYGEIHQISDAPPVKSTKSRCAIIGVYNLGYLKNALKLYKQESVIIGTQFYVYPVYWHIVDDKLVLEHGNIIEFDINDLNDDIITRINDNIDNNKQIYAQCVYTTDNFFVSHYFNRDALKEVISHVFSDYDVSIQQEGDDKRYLVVKIQCDKQNGNGITLLTSLNNVLGNIKTHDQIRSLEVFKNLID